MRTTRKSSGRTATGPGKQSTLSFSHRVTKSVPKPVKDSDVSSSVTPPAKPEKAEATPLKEEVEVAPVDTTPESESEQEEAEEAEVAPPKSEAELKAAKISKAAIERYWRGLESQRTAKQVHQEGLTTGERLLRHFDVNSQYGPCIGMTRIKRWQRAQRLGLSPPIEVLAVLLKEESEGKKGVEKAHMDEIMNPTVAAA